ncbi:MAG: hypothetical protein QOE65_607 [Solirubrobacteraceae bacterium]|jgi:RNA polymerase sigma-70 factor (ECF subfamily)|nr:hypothetical protein [Solirubrobacteraceae bacterium]
MTADGHERWADELGAYVLGTLDDVETRALELHVAGCRRCQEDERRLRAPLDALAAGVPQFEPSGALRRRVMRAARQGVPSERRPLWDRARRPAAVLAASALVAGAAGGYALRDGGGGAGARTLSARATPAAPGARARMIVRPGSAELVVERLAAPRPGHVYQVWLRERRRIRPSTLFTVDRRGRGAAAIPGGIAQGVQEVMVSEEPALGSAAPTSPPRLRISVT